MVKEWLYRDQLKPVAELDESGNLVAEFVYGTKANVPDYVLRGGATYRVISDQLGSPVMAVNVANPADVPFQARYEAFGKVTAVGGASLDWMPFGFAGGMYDQDTGLVRFGARDYDPESGRWTAKDPVGFDGDGANLYEYVLADPMTHVDASGEGIVDCAKAIAEYLRVKSKLDRRIQENLCNPPDRGHDKAIEQLRNRVDKEKQKVLRHCTDTDTLIELGILGLAAVALGPVRVPVPL